MARKKKETNKEVKSARSAVEKVFFNGNIYSKLSGMYFTEFNEAGVIQRLIESNPCISTMYGSELLGFTEDPDNYYFGSTNYISKDSTDALTTGSTYYPVYAKKVFSLSSQEDIDKTIGYVFPDLQWFSTETLYINASINKTLNGIEETISATIKAGEEKLELLKYNGRDENSSLKIDYVFKLSALLHGSSALSNWFGISDSIIGNFSIDSFYIDFKKNKSDSDLNYKTFIGQMYNCTNAITSTTAANTKLYDFVCGNYTKLSIQNTLDKVPIKSPYLFFKSKTRIDYYYNRLGCNIDSFKNAKIDFYTFNRLLDNFVDIQFPRGSIEKYETTLIPQNSGWYKFTAFNDDRCIIAIDNVVVLVNTYSGYSQSSTMIDTVKECIGRLIANNSGSFDTNKLRRLSTLINIKPYNSTANIPENVFPSQLANTTLNDIYTRISSVGQLDGTNDFPDDLIDGYAFYNLSACITSNSQIDVGYYFNSNDGKMTTRGVGLFHNYFGEGAYIYLLANTPYKFRCWHNDQYIDNADTGRSALFVMSHFCNDFTGTAEELAISAYNANFGESELYPSINEVLEAKKLYDNSDSEYESIWDTPSLSDYRDCGYELVPVSGSKYLIGKPAAGENSKLDRKILTIFTIRDLTEKEQQDLAKNAYSVDLATLHQSAANDNNITISFQCSQYLWKGRARWQ